MISGCEEFNETLMAKSNNMATNKARKANWQSIANSVLVICSLFCLMNSSFICNMTEM